MSRLLYRLSYTALMTSPPAEAGFPDHQSPNAESNRRPSPYHGDALPTELLGRAMKTLHGLSPIAQIRFAAPRPGVDPPRPDPRTGGPPMTGRRPHRPPDQRLDPLPGHPRAARPHPPRPPRRP